jgi:hypothetical protein
MRPLAYLDKTKDTEPAIGMVRFYFVVTRCEADAVERPLFDVFEAGYVVPAREFVLVF